MDKLTDNQMEDKNNWQAGIPINKTLGLILPPEYFSLQHRFKNGEVVDAIIHIGGNIVPIDAKFPLENFHKYTSEENTKEKEVLRKKFVADVKKHISDISKKYILPDEGTYDFALMYIPAENIFYETILKDESLGEERSISTSALKKRVIPVSPNSIFAYLQVIVQGLKGLRLERSEKEVYKKLDSLKNEMAVYEKFIEKSFRVVPKATITISKWGIIGLNKATLQNFVRMKDNYCHLHYNRSLNSIGIRTLLKKGEGAFKINRNKDNSYASITANSFLNSFGLSLEGSEKFYAFFDRSLGMIIVDLDVPIPKKRGRKKKVKDMD